MNNFLSSLRKNRTLVIILAIMVAFFLLAVQGMSTKDWVITLLRSLSVGAVTFLVASGFSIILGLMDVLNLAHGVLFMIGAYVGWSVYVRPDTFIDLLTPVAFLVSGFLLMPVWERFIDRASPRGTIKRVWPWIGLGVAAILLVYFLPRVPLSIWDAKDFNDSPISWTQVYERGTLIETLEPGVWMDVAPVIGLGGLLLGSLVLAASLAGFAHQRRAGGPRMDALNWRSFLAFAIVLLFGLLVYTFNQALTDFLLNLDTTLLFLIAILSATLTGVGLGALMESTLIRPLYDRAIYQIMLTFGLGFIGTEIVRAIWGRSGFTMPKPSLFNGSGEGCPAASLSDLLTYRCSTFTVTFGEETARIRTYNEIFLIVVGVIVLVAVWLLLQRTRLGMIIRAGVQDGEMVEALGINVRRVFTLVFGLGVGLAALGGVLAAPSMGLSEAMGVNLLLSALIALAIGGLTSYPGAAAGSVVVGLLQQFIIKYGQLGINLPFLDEPFKPTPPLVPASTVLLMVVILLVMPQGLFGRKE
jgi:branched-chain amino acid transport system permease protein